MSVRRVAIVLWAAAACGGDDAVAVVDAHGVDAGLSDASVADCYVEADDLGNMAVPEDTGLVYGVSAVAICGTIAASHPGPAELDQDRFQVTVTRAEPALLRVTAPGATSLDRVEVTVTTADGTIARARVLGGQGAAIMALPVGAHTIALTAIGAANLAVPYRITIASDDPTLRCPIDPTSVAYDEVDEAAAGHRANDMITVRTQPQLNASATPDPDDRPEATMRAVSAGGVALLRGTSADVEPAGDDYHDRDCFAVYTGQTTNQLELRAGWVGTADLDLLVFEADHPDEPLGSPAPSITGELMVTAVKPSTLYWVWIGGSTRSNALPSSYMLAVCGHEVTAAP